ncbi:hypothetical protein BDQ12DRAFT_723897 [Crucibulum laeve]|uniref:Uncharacterized protein n=1 Tax=Crucibulum laeve TaxID=68775 RepID=A0A5C3M102_9AGAR|nr:hypothetical protein BDQ12DRAFT_723897 [Crucibulum laeve]
MSGEPLPKAHVTHLRVIITGYIGACGCRRAYKINALAEPSVGPVQRQEYLYYTPQEAKREVLEWILRTISASFTRFLEDKDVITHDSKVTLKGWAYSSSRNWAERVEVSVNRYAASLSSSALASSSLLMTLLSFSSKSMALLHIV